MPPLFHRFFQRRNIGGGNPLHPLFFRLQIHHEKNSHKVQNRRPEPGEHDRHVRNSEEGAHDKGRGSHDGRHENSPRAGARLHRPGEVARVPYSLHEWNCKGPRGCHVCLGASGDRPHEGRGDDGNFRRASPVFSRQGHGQVVKELARAGGSEKGTEKNEHEDVAGRNGQSRSIDPFVCEPHPEDNTFPVETPVGEEPREIGAKPGIGEKKETENRQGQPYGAAAGFREQQHGHDSHGEIEHEGVHVRFKNAVVGQEHIDGGKDGEPCENPVEKGGSTPGRDVEGGIKQECYCHESSEMDGVHLDAHDDAYGVHPEVNE